MVTVHMNLFLQGYQLVEGEVMHRDSVMQVGETAERNVVAFLEQRSTSANGTQSALKHMRVLHRAGALNNCITAHKVWLAAGIIAEPSPVHMQDVLETA